MGLFITISILGFIAGLVGIWKDLKGGWGPGIAILLSFCLFASFGYNFYEYYQTLKKEKYAKVWGNFNFPTDIDRKPSLFFGKYQLNSVTFSNDKWVVEDKWETWLENGKVNLRGTIRDREGNIVFQVNGTDWKNWTGKDFNYDDRGIEVKDSKGNIIFQLEFDKKENKVSVFGIFYYGPDRLVLAGRDDNKVISGQSPSSGADINLFIKSIKPMFKYPRENHLGKRV